MSEASEAEKQMPNNLREKIEKILGYRKESPLYDGLSKTVDAIIQAFKEEGESPAEFQDKLDSMS